MGGRDRRGQLQHPREDLPQAGTPLNAVIEPYSHDMLQHQERSSRVKVQIEYARQAGMLDGDEQSPFGFEPLPLFPVGVELTPRDLDHHVAVERGMTAEIDVGLPALRESALYKVPANLGRNRAGIRGACPRIVRVPYAFRSLRGGFRRRADAPQLDGLAPQLADAVPTPRSRPPDGRPVPPVPTHRVAAVGAGRRQGSVEWPAWSSSSSSNRHCFRTRSSTRAALV